MTKYQAILSGLRLDDKVVVNRFNNILTHHINQTVIDKPYCEEFNGVMSWVNTCHCCKDVFVSDVPVDYCTRCLR